MIQRKKITLEERVDNLTRRMDNLTKMLSMKDSPVRLRKIPEMEKRLDIVFRHLITNEDELRLFRDIVTNLQKDFYRNKATERK